MDNLCSIFEAVISTGFDLKLGRNPWLSDRSLSLSTFTTTAAVAASDRRRKKGRAEGRMDVQKKMAMASGGWLTGHTEKKQEGAKKWKKKK